MRKIIAEKSNNSYGEAGKDFLLGFFFCPETLGQERNIFSFVIDFREVKMQ